jgi:SAM-dependent methyltransferase/uncharacterized protein YbaR (Trm112 family)
MWLRLADLLRCPACKGALRLDVFEHTTVSVAPDLAARARDRGILDGRFAERVEAGALLCDMCQAMFPIVDGLPVMLCYRTPMHARLAEQFASRLGILERTHRALDHEPATGERAVMESFSKEWLAYHYDGVIWEMSYADHEARFLQEIGPALHRADTTTFLEVGCGIGITTQLAHKNSSADAVGLDLSLAVWKASRHYRDNPFLHFVQASVFAMPFAAHTFDIIYSRGVLHHTVSTERAFRSMAQLCKPNGTAYLWVYGIGSIRETLFRRLVYGLEAALRPALSTAPDSLPARAFLTAMGAGYVLFNALRRATNPAIQPLTLERGIHAARDRFTPRFAHRHELAEVVKWFREAGFERPEVLDWRAMPAADHDDFRRNVGVRGILKAVAT